MRDLVSGGQVTMHGIRMLGQVMQKLWAAAVFGFIGISIYWFFDTTTPYNRHIMRSWLEAELRSSFYSANSPELHKVMMTYTKHYTTKGSNKITPEVVKTSVVGFYRYCHPLHRHILKEKIYNSLKAGGFGSAGIVALMLIFFARRGIAERIKKFVRGGEITTEKALIRSIKKMNKKAGQKSMFKICGIPYPYKSERQSTLVIGSTGQGKTQLILDIVEQIRKKGEKVIIYDKKGDYINHFYQKEKDHILNPFDQRGEKWNIMKEIDHEGVIKTLAESFIPDRGSRGGEGKVWEDAARLAFTEIVRKILKGKKSYTNEELLNLILKSDLSELAEYVKHTNAQGIINMSADKAAASVVFVLGAHLNSLGLSKGNISESFSIREWMKKEDGSALFITSQSRFESELSALQTAWFEIVISNILSKEQNSGNTWVIMDELGSLKKIPSLHRALSSARSYGGCFILGLQNISQLQDIYGHHNAGSISAECNTRCIFKSNDPDTAKWASQNIGDEEVIESNRSLSYGAHEVRDGVSVTRNTKVRPLAMASEIQNMERLHLYLKMVDNPIIKKEIKYKDRKIIEPDAFVQVGENVVKNQVAQDSTKANGGTIVKEGSSNNTVISAEGNKVVKDSQDRLPSSVIDNQGEADTEETSEEKNSQNDSEVTQKTKTSFSIE